MILELDASSLTVGQRALLTSKSKQVLMAGGYGSGKTTGLDIKLLQLRTVNAGVPGLLVAPTRPLLFSVTLRRLLATLRRTVPLHMMPQVKDPQGECYLDFGDGVPIFLRSATRPDSIDGLDVGWACGDEIRYWSRQAYDITLGRVRVPCELPQKAFASTPSMGWMYDEFAMGKPDRELIVAGTKENAHNLAPGFIDNLRASYSPRMQRAVIDGEFTILEGAVFEEFDPNPQTSPWIVDWAPQRPDYDRCPVYLALDPGWRRSSWLFIMERAPMEWVVFDQLQLDNTSDMDAVARINRLGYPIDEIWTDPAADATQSSEGADTLMALRQIEARSSTARVLYSTGKKARGIPFGVDKLRVLLGGYDGYPRRILFTRELAEEERGKPRGVVKDLGALRYPELRDGRPVTDLPLKDGVTDHSCLVGCTRVYADGVGWAELQSLAGSRPRILTPDGMRQVSVLDRMLIQTPVWEIVYETGETTVATGDHPFLVSARCCCGRYLADVSWRTVLQMRVLLQQAEGQRQEGVPASGAMGECCRCDSCGLPCTPHQRGPVGQQDREPVGYDRCATSVASRNREPEGVPPGGQGRGSSVAQERARARVAQETRQRVVGRPTLPGVYLPRVWSGLSVAQAARGEVLPSELQGHCASQASWNTSYQRVSDIRPAGLADVWCAGVPGVGAFVLEDGTVSSNTDSLRYFAVSRWLRVPQLRSKDRELLKSKHLGYKVA